MQLDLVQLGRGLVKKIIDVDQAKNIHVAQASHVKHVESFPVGIAIANGPRISF